MKISKFLCCLTGFAFVAMFAFNSCSKDNLANPDKQEVISKNDNASAISLNETEAEAGYLKLIAANEARLAGTGVINSFSCQLVARVPQNYATIQEAVDAVCSGGTVFVSAGVYNEVVNVNKPGVTIKANGVVTLNGRFFLTPDANNVTIQQFSIFPPATGTNIERSGIFAAGVTGGNVKLNTITGAFIAVNYRNVTGVSFTQNTVTGSSWGILIAANGILYPGNVLSSNNLIAHNTVTGTTAASPIHLQGNCDNNTVHDNTVTLKTNVNPVILINAGIMLLSTSPSETCDNNTIRNNVVTDNQSSGVWVTSGCDGNTIGPDNIFSSNRADGILLGFGSANSTVYNNTALNNGFCDIVNDGTNNTFSNNIAGCTFGF